MFCKPSRGSDTLLSGTKTLSDCVWSADSAMMRNFCASSEISLRGSRLVRISPQCMYSFYLTSEEVVS